MCNENLAIEPAGTTKLTCGEDKQWSTNPSDVRCKPLSCQEISLPNGKVKKADGTTDATEEDYLVGKTIKFACDDGFAGVEADVSMTCERAGETLTAEFRGRQPTCNNINDCEGVTCGGHGTCQDAINSYTCLCNPGYKSADATGDEAGSMENGSPKTTCVQYDPCAITDDDIANDIDKCGDRGVCRTNEDFDPTANPPRAFDWACTCFSDSGYSGYDCKKDSSATIDRDTFCQEKPATFGNYPDPRNCQGVIICGGGRFQREDPCTGRKVFDSTATNNREKQCVDIDVVSIDTYCTMNVFD